MRKTKIVCTLGPATDDEEVLKKLLLSGMNVARLNFSHGSYEEHLNTANLFKRLRDELKLPAGLLLDTRGPEIRLKTFENGRVELKEGSLFTLTGEDISGNEKRVSVTYRGLAKDVMRGDRILLDDGLIELKVVGKTDTDIECEVINGGIVKDRKGVNVPDVTINLPFISEKDTRDLKFAVENDFDFVAASFVRNSDCVKEIRKILEDAGGKEIRVIAKIENREGVDNIDEIIRVSDGIMVARGDMGVEIPFEELPAIQKSIIKKCYRSGKPVITATQMLDSMTKNPRPTRAEITDVANAIYDGTSATMLSGETSIGDYPVEAVNTMSKIAQETEKDIDYIKNFSGESLTVSRNVTNAISHATCHTAHSLGGAAIVTVTKSGRTAYMISKFRPECPIIATTISRKVFHQLSLTWGVFPILTDEKENTDEIFEQAIDRVSNTPLVKNGDLVVITGGMHVGVSGTTNTLKVHIIGDVLAEGKGAYKGIASGPLCVVQEGEESLADFHAGDVLVIERSHEKILPAITGASALITEEEGKDSEAAVVGKALQIPVLTNVTSATKILKSGTVVTVDASRGFVYAGIKKEEDSA